MPCRSGVDRLAPYPYHEQRMATPTHLILAERPRSGVSRRARAAGMCEIGPPPPELNVDRGYNARYLQEIARTLSSVEISVTHSLHRCESRG